MIRGLDQDDVGVSCRGSRRSAHPATDARPAGYMALKEAGAGLTILGYECPRCYRKLYVTEEPPVSQPAGVDISILDGGDVE